METLYRKKPCTWKMARKTGRENIEKQGIEKKGNHIVMIEVLPPVEEEEEEEEEGERRTPLERKTLLK